MEHVPAKLQEQLFAHLFRLLATLLQALIAVHESPARILAERERQSNGIPEQDRAGFETYKQILLPPDGQEHPGLASQGRNASDRIRSPDHSPTRSRSRSRECERHNKPSDDSDSHRVYCIIYQFWFFQTSHVFFWPFLCVLNTLWNFYRSFWAPQHQGDTHVEADLLYLESLWISRLRPAWNLPDLWKRRACWSCRCEMTAQ